MLYRPNLRLASLVAAVCLLAAACAGPHSHSHDRWRAWLDSPGGELPFEMELVADEAGQFRVALFNGEERIEVPDVTIEGRRIEIAIPHYASQIRATFSDDGHSLTGEWTKRAAEGAETRMTFRAELGGAPRFEPPAEVAAILPLDERWRVEFESSDDPAVGVFKSLPDGTVHGTFMTTTGDYRYLAGVFDGNELELSVFDGAHAFLFRATRQDDGSLKGDFWSRDTWHETWTATADPNAALPDAFTQTTWQEGVDVEQIRFPDLDGQPRSLLDPEFAGQARLLVVFGTWCPNCNDASDYLVDLHDRYADQGLSILGLAFELSGDFETDAAQVRTYVDHHDIAYPILVAGLSDKAKASESFPVLDRVRSYPTTIFIDADGRVRGVHTGFSGPATGSDYVELKQRFETLIEEMLASSASSAS